MEPKKDLVKKPDGHRQGHCNGAHCIHQESKRERECYTPGVSTPFQSHRDDAGAARTEREREILHLSSPEADSGAARTSPGRSQRWNSVINTKKDKPMSQQRREQSLRQGSNYSHQSLANTRK